MTITVIEYEVKTNEDWLDTFELETAAPVESDPPVPVDITGSSFVAQLRTSTESLLVTLEASTANGGLVVTEPTEGKVAWNIEAETMATITPGLYVLDVVWFRPDGGKDTIIEGTVLVKRGVTRV